MMRRNGPWWSRWGLVGILILGLLAVTTGIVPSALTQTKQAAEEAVAEIKQHRAKEEELRRELSQRMEQQVNLLRVMCFNQAKTPDERRECLK